MLKPFSRTLLALALLSPLTVQAQQDDAARQKELEAARTELRRAAQRVAELSRGADTLQAPIRIDRVVAGREMPVRDLVEDELILAVPYAPRHEDCEPAARPRAQGQDEKISPFAGLRGLMRGKH